MTNVLSIKRRKDDEACVRREIYEIFLLYLLRINVCTADLKNAFLQADSMSLIGRFSDNNFRREFRSRKIVANAKQTHAHTQPLARNTVTKEQATISWMKIDEFLVSPSTER